jgi:hypothetical protein
VWKTNDTLKNAWAGGFQAPQFSTIDLDADGLPELVVFDRMDGTILPFRRERGAWQYRPDLQALFPRLSHWMLLRDYDGDGDKDLFTATSVSSNVRVFRNIHPTGSPPIWRLVYDTLKSSYYGYSTYLYSGAIDIPGIADIDGDGDVDLLVYEVLGTLAEWHRNQALELYGRTDTLALELTSGCWGHVYENYNPTTNQFAFSSYFCGPGQRDQRIQHSGGSLLPIQLNGDTLIDIIVGDFGPPYLIAGVNSGTRQIAHIEPATAQAPYPLSAPANMPGFPAAYYEDVTGDGKPDLLVANNDGLAGTDRQSVWLYPNVGRIDSPAWAPPIIPWLQNTMLDIGTSAHPTLTDLNRDGFPDLILTCRQTYHPTAPYAQAWLFWGTPDGFTLADSNWLDLPQYTNLVAPVFAAGDIDGNQRLDLLMGTSTGTLWRWEETAPQTLNFQLLSNNFLSGFTEATPLLYDIDGDNDLDLLIGTRNGRISLLTNQNGSFQLVTNYLGQIEVRDTISSLLGFARPAFLHIPGSHSTTALVVGNMTGFLRIYEPNWADPTGTWPILGDLSSVITGGTFVSPTTWFFGDSSWVFLGIRRGGVRAYRISGVTAQVVGSAQAVPLYEIRIGLEGLHIEARELIQVRILDLSGRLLRQGEVLGTTLWERPLSGGIYVVQVIFRQGLDTRKVVWP